jgi:hypothetical protein
MLKISNEDTGKAGTLLGEDLGETGVVGDADVVTIVVAVQRHASPHLGSLEQTRRGRRGLVPLRLLLPSPARPSARAPPGSASAAGIDPSASWRASVLSEMPASGGGEW